MKKETKKIFLVLAFFALSGGLFYNFQELWMADNSLSVKTIGIVFSLCSLITVSTIFLCSNIIKKQKVKKFCSGLLLIKGLIILCLFILNHSGLNVVIKFLIMIDYAIDTEIYACIYPMIAMVGKNDRTYAAKDLMYSAMYNTGVLITGFFLGMSVGYFKIDYNIYCLVAALLIFVSLAILHTVNLEKYYDKESENNNKKSDLLNRLIKKIQKDKISLVYLLFIFNGQISYTCVLSLIVTILTTGLSFTPQEASNLMVFMGVFAVVLGIIVLAKLTFKNSYITLTIKYGIRALLYILAVILNNKVMFLIALMYPKIISESYSHITDAPYINRFDDEYQLAFCNLREMVNYLGKSIGTLICGLALTISIRLNFVFAAIFGVLQATFSFYALHLRTKEAV
ncbi:MAG: MFS transporter [Firmicutes bacterium]|nr:MFS transporter [Bacillota bacterium]